MIYQVEPLPEEPLPGQGTDEAKEHSDISRFAQQFILENESSGRLKKLQEKIGGQKNPDSLGELDTEIEDFLTQKERAQNRNATTEEIQKNVRKNMKKKWVFREQILHSEVWKRSIQDQNIKDVLDIIRSEYQLSRAERQRIEDDLNKR